MEKQAEQNDLFECTDCGAQVSSSAEVCPNCGANLNVKVKPWARWVARFVDINSVGSLLVIALFIIVPQIAELRFIYLNMIVTFIYVFIESSLLVLWGTTPGKYLLNIKLVPVNGQTITFDMALKRSFMVWAKGMGFGFPLATVIMTAYWHGKLKKDKITSWDQELRINVIHTKISTARFFLTALIFVAIISVNVFFFVLGR